MLRPVSLLLGVLSAFLPSQAAKAGPEWPLLRSAVFLRVKRAAKTSVCSGVAIGRNLILTAGHCVDGALTITASFAPDPAARPEHFITASRWYHHPDYDPKRSLFLNDLGVVELSRPLPDEVPIAELASEEDLLRPGSRLERVGYGRREGYVKRTWTDPLLEDRFKGGALVLKDRYAIPGDSGGPVFIRKDGRLRLVGLHSTLQGRERTYIVYVPAHRQWIASAQQAPQAVPDGRLPAAVPAEGLPAALPSESATLTTKGPAPEAAPADAPAATVVQ